MIYIGWDVGAWYTKTKDALVVLNENGDLIGRWSGGLREKWCEALWTSPKEFLVWLHGTCSLPTDVDEKCDAILAIDAPLGLPHALMELFTSGTSSLDPKKTHKENSLLYRQAEITLGAKREKAPLSAVQDMIGSQATKAVFILRRMGMKPDKNGEWHSLDYPGFKAIETYPSACPENLREGIPKKYTDIDDAHTCAKVARMFKIEKMNLVAPKETPPEGEGWIWVPKSLGELNE